MAQRNPGVSLKPSKSRAALTITHPNAAGIDIWSASHFVAVPPDRDDEPVREFASFTADLNVVAGWLKACGIDTVAMESTGVYWANSTGRCNISKTEVLNGTTTGLGIGTNGATDDVIAWQARRQSAGDEASVLEMHCRGNRE